MTRLATRILFFRLRVAAWLLLHPIPYFLWSAWR
jgi:hypothetical protein